MLNHLIEYFSKGETYKKLIEPIIIRKDNKGNFDSTELLNRLVYTIVDQQRDVASIIIPIWVNLMYKNVNPDFLSESPYASEFVQSMFKAYGHQNYHTKFDFKVRGKGGASRTDAFIQAYKNNTPEDFQNLIVDNSQNIELIFEELIKLKYISLKSASFFLRDVEGLEYDILPIDVNVAYSFQYTGLFFDSDSFDFKDEIIPVSKRTHLREYSLISDRIFDLCSNLGYNPHEINRYLFLLGADFCQSLKCDTCCVRNECYFNSLPSEKKEIFKRLIKSD